MLQNRLHLTFKSWAGSKSTTPISAVVKKVKKVEQIQAEESAMTYMR